MKAHRSPQRRVRKKKPFTTIREFIESCISGEHTKAEVGDILDKIEEGIGLEEHDRVMAEKFNEMPKSDEEDPIWQRGFEAGKAAARAGEN